MLRLDPPAYSFDVVLAQCHSGITGNPALAEKLAACRARLVEAGERYLAACGVGDLYTIPPTHDGDIDPLVIGAMTKSELVKLYEQYFVAREKPARKIYDDILVAALEKCPFCGGVGRPRNLDHFLPKARFPQFSVFPNNLVPSCRDCNIDGKATNFAACAEDQVIQPYADHDRFFEEQWIFASFDGAIDDPRTQLRFFARPPQHWGMVDAERALRHFKAFDLATRYEIKAAGHRGTVLRQIRLMQQNGASNDYIRHCLLEPGVAEASFPNHWQRGIYQAFIGALDL